MGAVTGGNWAPSGYVVTRRHRFSLGFFDANHTDSHFIYLSCNFLNRKQDDLSKRMLRTATHWLTLEVLATVKASHEFQEFSHR